MKNALLNEAEFNIVINPDNTTAADLEYYDDNNVDIIDTNQNVNQHQKSQPISKQRMKGAEAI